MMKKLANLKYALPLLMAWAFPFYFKELMSTWSFYSTDIGTQGFLALVTIVVMSFVSAVFISNF